MGIEIERKFLVNKDKFKKLNLTDFEYLYQGYISVEVDKTIRIRKLQTNAFLTIKGITENATRLEFEYEIPIEDAKQLLEKFSTNMLEKKRYKFVYDNKIWEIDEFLGDNEDLLVAEIELKSVDEIFEIPNWIEQEVTDDVRYYNANLTINPFKNWK